MSQVARHHSHSRIPQQKSILTGRSLNLSHSERQISVGDALFVASQNLCWYTAQTLSDHTRIQCCERFRQMPFGDPRAILFVWETNRDTKTAWKSENSLSHFAMFVFTWWPRRCLASEFERNSLTQKKQKEINLCPDCIGRCQRMHITTSTWMGQFKCTFVLFTEKNFSWSKNEMKWKRKAKRRKRKNEERKKNTRRGK